MPQKAVFDFADNPELTNLAMSKEAGDDCEITIKGKFVSADGGKLEMSIDEMEFEYDDNEVEIEPSTEDPVALEVFAVSDLGAESSEKGDEDLGDDSLLDDETEDN
jgi:hypothetical protein